MSTTAVPDPSPVRPLVPPILYLPLMRGSTQDDPQVQLRRLKDDRIALLAYTALDRLVDRCGENQPWIIVRTPDLGELKGRQNFDVVVFDLEVPQEFRQEGQIR